MKYALKIHLCLGLLAAVFLIILGLTGSIMAFEGDVDHWLHPRLWYVRTQPRTLPETELIAKVQQQFPPAQVSALQIARQTNLAQVMQLTDRSAVFINPYDGSILGRVVGTTSSQRILGYIHQFHLHLGFDPRSSIAPAGKLVISCSGLILCLMVPTGLILWYRTKKLAIRRDVSWFRIWFDTHHVVGVYASVFLWVAAFTGILIGFDFGERAIYSLTHSNRPSFPRPPQSTPAPGATPISVDQALEVARRTMPAASVDGLSIPLDPEDSFNIVMRVPEETSGIAHSTVTVDQYSGRVLQVHDFLADSLGYRWIRFNRSIHTGDIWGLPGHIVVSLSSLLLVIMVATGVVIWWKKMAT